MTTDPQTDRLHDEILDLKAELAQMRDLLRTENQRANNAIDRETTAEQAALEAEQDRDRLRAVVARIAQMADAWEQRLPEVIRTPAVVSAIRAALEPAAAVPVAAPPTTEQGALRELFAAAIRAAACPGECGKTEEECAKERIQPFAWHHGRLAVVEGSPEMFADAVLAVLPAPADRAAEARVRALHQEYAFGDDPQVYCAHCNQISGGWIPWPCPTVQALDDGPSREATEPQPETQTAAHPLTVLTAPALLATIKELRDLRAPLIDALATVHQSMTSCVGDEWAMEWLGKVWSQLPLEVRAAAGDTDAADELAAEAPHTETPDAPAVSSRPGTEQEAQDPHAVCVCGHSRGEHVTVSGRLLCDECDPDSTDNLVCKGFEAL